MTIPVVKKSQEGLYKCSISKTMSPESFMTVAEADGTRRTEGDPASSPPSSSVLLPLSLIGLATGLSICLSILLVILYCKRIKRNTGGAAPGPMDVTYGQVDIKTKNKKRDKPLPPEPDVIYASVRTGAGLF